ncbi:MAG: hypothetical protein ISS58_04840 [Dehalococcoidales bacterium]|jgi:CRISPR/Cas system-associated endonuclease/helicase Cas3|nr:hypothetical protein [Dehalococcoidales bacterium]
MTSNDNDSELTLELEQLNAKLILEQLDAGIELENEMDSANEQMERDEIFNKLKYYSVAYKAGFNEGFSIGQQLILKHDITKAEIIHKKYLELKARFEISG